MPGLVDTGLRLLRSLVGSGSDAPAPLPGLETALRGAVAVAVTEACVSEVAGLGAGAPADVLARAWEEERRREGFNVFGAPLTDIVAPTSRGTLASAVGMALAGARATAFLSGVNLAGLPDMLTAAAGRHVPLVVHGVSRALNAHAGARGSGHEAWHAISDSGVLQLFARNAQEAVDFALIGRRIAEATLRPVVVFMDEERCSAVTQDVRLPGAELIRRYLGAPGDMVDCASPGQAMLFGPKRRRIPRWHDLERPVLHGAIQGRDVWSLGAVGAHPFTLDTILPIIEQALDAFAELTGRRHQLVRCHRVEDAEVVLVSQGSCAEAVETVVDHLRSQRKLRVGAVSLIGLRPFPGPALVQALRGKRHVAVLERVDAMLAEDPPLLRELRATFDKAIENHRHDSAVHATIPAVAHKDVPYLHAVVYGLGGYPLRAGDLVALVEELLEGGRPLVYLGMDFTRRESRYPKRQVLLDQLRRLWPGELAPGLTGYQNLDVRPEGTTTISVHRVGGAKGTALAADVGRVLQVILGGHVRGRAGESWERWQAPRVDRVVHALKPVDPGASGPVDLALVLGLSERFARDPLADISVGGAVLVADSEQPDQPLLPLTTWRSLESRGVRVFAVPCPEGAEAPAFRERVYALTLRLVAERGAELPPVKKLLAARHAMLDGLDAAEVEARMDAFEASLALTLETVSAPEAVPVEPMPPAVPMAVRHFTRADGTYDSLPRFWDQVGILFRDGQLQELLPDPYLATGAVPPLTSTFNDLTPLRKTFPCWDPVACSGCGRCWSGCPDSAIGPLAATVGRLIEGAMALAAVDGVVVDPLRPVMGKLAGRVSSQLRATEEAPLAFGPVLCEAFDWFRSKAGLSAERLAPVETAFDAVLRKVDDLPISGTHAFFVDPEKEAKGTGEILTLAFNPDACKACGICAAACPEQAVSMEPQTPVRVQQARDHWQRWERLPDTAGETIARVKGHPDVGPVAAMLLSRACLLGLAGGDSAEAGSGEKVAVRLLMAAAEYELQPHLQRHLDLVEGLRGRLTEAITKQLVHALPVGDPAAVALGLAGVRRPEMDLAELMQRLEAQDIRGRVDVAQLRRLSDLAGRLQDLQWRLAQGPDGLGRARLALAIESGPVAAWAGAFPDNPFHVPVVLAGAGEGLHLARGLLEGQLRAVQDDIRLVRQAQTALESPGEYGRETAALAGMTWRDLSPEERRLVPPVVVVGHEDSLTGRNLSTLATVLDLELPVKILVLAGNGLGLASGRADVVADEVGCGWDGTLGEVGLLALGRRRALVTQCSLAFPEQLFEGLTQAMAHVGPALVRIHAPSPGRHGFPVEQLLSQCELAVKSRAFPLFRYDPTDEGVFGACLHLEGNPEIRCDWARDEAGATLSPAHWVLTEERFAEHLPPLTPELPQPTPFLEWLELPSHTRHGRTPFILDGAEPPTRRVVSPVLAAVAEERLRTWRTLQELAGVVTPFTAQVRERLEIELGARHAKELSELRARHAAELEEARGAVERELGGRVRDSLLQLAGYGPGGGSTGAEG
jgi:pyruvate-ferredoxin/flavodoxin oxidoreductase